MSGKNKSQSFSVKDLLGIRLSTTLLTMKRYLVQSFETNKAALSFEEWMNLLPLIENPGITQNQLGKFLGKDKTSISRMVSQWVKKGLIIVQKYPNDMRAVHLKPTEKALRWHQEAQRLVGQADLVFSQGLSSRDLDVLLSLLAKISSSVSGRLDRNVRRKDCL